MTGFPDEIRAFIQSQEWTPAWSQNHNWPHEFLSRDHSGGILFDMLIRHILAHGYEANLYGRLIMYINDNGMVYWTIAASVEETKIVNRFSRDELWEYRLEYGSLPEPAHTPAGEDLSSHEAETIAPWEARRLG